MTTYRPVDHLGPEDADWLRFVYESGKSEAKHRRNVATRYFVRRARDDEIMDADIDLSSIPEGATIFAIAWNMTHEADLGQQRKEGITLFSVDPSLCKLVEKLNAAAALTLFRRASGASGGFHLVRTRNFPVQAPPPPQG